MIGVRLGGSVGTRDGVALGISGDPVGPDNGMSSVTRDALSGIFCPASTGEWTTTLTTAGQSGNPLSTWLCQEASGNLADSLAANTLTITGASWAYRQAVTGWSRLAVTLPDAASNHNAQNTTTVPDVSTTSVLLMLYVSFPAVAPAAGRRIARLDSTTGAIAAITSSPVVQCLTQGTGGTTASGISSPLGAVRPVIIAVNRTAGTAKVYTNQDKVTGTQGTYAGLAVGFGSSSSLAMNMGVLYGALFSGANAERTDAQVKSLLTTLGWSPAWT